MKVKTEILVKPVVEFNRDNVCYCKKNDLNVTELEEKGYKLWHRPYFAMKGYTHDIYTIDMAERKILDAAPVGSKTTNYEEIIKMEEI